MANNITSFFRNALELYEYMCRPVCTKAEIQLGELNILMFLANNPDKNTAMDVHKSGGMKPSMISMLVEKLVQHGYLERQAVPDDRRKIKLVITESAEPIINEGRAVQRKFMEYIMEGATKEELEVYARVRSLMEKNLLEYKEKMLRGELD